MKTRYSGRDIWLIAVCVVLAGVSAMNALHTGKTDFALWFFGLGAVLLLVRPLRRRVGGGTAPYPPKSGSQNERRKERVEFDDHEIRRYLSDGRHETIAWNEIDEISIITTDGGPWLDDVFWLFMNRDRSKGCAVSNDAEGFKELLPRIQSLPGFDNRAVVAAMGSTSNQHFIVWKNSYVPPT